MTDDELRAFWREAGGVVHRPHVETCTMPEAKLLPLLRRMLADAARLDILERKAHEPGGIRLHAEPFVKSRTPCQRGLGLQHRTLREAVDQFMEASNAG